MKSWFSRTISLALIFAMLFQLMPMSVLAADDQLNVSTTYTESTCGLDCSGYVSRCWELGEHHYTGALYNVAEVIEDDELLRGDALNSSGHVVLYDYPNTSNGTYVLYECTTTNDYDRVAHTTRTVTSLSGEYTPIRYNNVSG